MRGSSLIIKFSLPKKKQINKSFSYYEASCTLGYVILFVVILAFVATTLSAGFLQIVKIGLFEPLTFSEN